MNPDYIRSIPLSIYRHCVRPETETVLDKIGNDIEYGGAADGNILSLLYTLIFTCQLTKVLQLGTYVGFSTLVLADALHKNRGNLITVDISEPHMKKAELFVGEAGLSESVHFILGSTLDPKIRSKISAQTPYELIFVDSSHSYQSTLEELDYYWPLLKIGGFMVLHDAGPAAAKFDPTGKGGVGKAIYEWVSGRNDCRWMIMEPPVWPNPCGCGLLTRVAGQPRRSWFSRFSEK